VVTSMTTAERDLIRRFLSAACERLETEGVPAPPVKPIYIWHVIAWLRGLVGDPDFKIN
jgi:hypothetical protein